MLALNTDASNLDHTTLKLRCVFGSDFEEAARSGRTGKHLYGIALTLRMHLPCEVETNEGYNRLVKCIADRSPNIKLALLDARANIKKRLGVGSRGASSKWSTVRSSAALILDESLAHSELIYPNAFEARCCGPVWVCGVRKLSSSS